jgi:hypothetical protein
MARAFLWGKEQGNIGLKNILFSGNSETSDEGAGRPSGEGDITARSHSPDRRNFWDSICGGGNAVRSKLSWQEKRLCDVVCASMQW